MRLGGAGDAAVKALEGDGARAAGQADAVGDLGDGADVGEFVSRVGERAGLAPPRRRRPRA